MYLLDQYVRLFSLCPGASVAEEMELSLEQVASILSCTLRNATLTVKKMQSHRWLQWQPGRGRGKRSSLTFFYHPGDLVFGIARERVQTGEIQAARAIIQRYSEELPELASRYQRWMLSQFGLHQSGQGKRRVDTLRFCFHRTFPSLDPLYVLLYSEIHLAGQVFDCLVRYDHQRRQIEPQLAYYWESDADGKEWMFTLRKGVLFHHGRLMTAEDVIFSLLRLREAEPHSPHRWLADGIEKADAIDDYTVRIRLRKPNRLFLHFLSKVHTAIVPSDFAQGMKDEFARHPVGSGPFRIVRNDDSMLVLEANETYYGERPFLDRIEIWVVPGLVNDTQEEELGIAYVPLEKLDDKPVLTGWATTVQKAESFQYVSFNAVKPGPLQSIAFRRALSIILDPHEMISELGVMREKAEDLPTTPLDDASTVHLLEASGYQGETLRLYTFPDPDHKEDACWIQQRCAEYGISLEIGYRSPEELARPAVQMEADIVLDCALADEREEMSVIEFVLAGVGGLRHHLPEDTWQVLTRHVGELLGGENPEERSDSIRSIRERLWQDRIFLPLYRNRIELLSHPGLHGISLDAHGWVDFRRLFVKTAWG